MAIEMKYVSMILLWFTGLMSWSAGTSTVCGKPFLLQGRLEYYVLSQ